jgi:glycosyltransferase involved in cell wall biosynthesis
MTTTCLINNYNYARFLGEAIDSALAQTVPFDEIIVVDDGSTDESVELLKARYARQRSVQIVAKQNQGQLSCFNEGFARATGELVFFLDADDVYDPEYLAQSLAAYERNRHYDFVICGHRTFGRCDTVRLKFAENRDLGYSVIAAVYLREWIGGPTSCLSMRRGVLEKILPVPFLADWRTRADDCLVFGASLAGARKYYLAKPLVRYRIHDHNQFAGRKADRCEVYRRRLAVNVLFEHFQRQFGYDVPRLAEFHHREFRTIERPTVRQFFRYLGISLSARLPMLRRLACAGDMAGHLLRTSLRPTSEGTTDMASDASAATEDILTMPPRGLLPSASHDVIGRRAA